MMMNLSQTKLVGLTMELDLKAREYKTLCDKLEEIKEKGIDPNDERLLEVKKMFQKNHDEIVEINTQINELKKTEDIKEKEQLEQYNPDNMFKKESDAPKIEKTENADIAVVQTEGNIFTKFIEKIKRLFKNKN